MSFLDLPPELRLQVHGIIAIPDVAPFAEYRGLYLSCHQVKDELDKEGPQGLFRYLDKIKDGIPNTILVNTFSKSTFWHTLDIHIRFECPRDHNDHCIESSSSFLSPVLGLHVRNLTFAVSRPKARQMISFASVQLSSIMMLKAADICANQAVMELPVMPRDEVSEFIELLNYCHEDTVKGWVQCWKVWDLQDGECVARVTWIRRAH